MTLGDLNYQNLSFEAVKSYSNKDSEYTNEKTTAIKYYEAANNLLQETAFELDSTQGTQYQK